MDALMERAGTGGPIVAGAAFAIAWTPCVGPTLGAILSSAANSESPGRGAFLLAVYSAGLAIPFLLTALAFARMTTAFDLVKRHYAVIMAVGGVILIAMGVLIWTDELFRLNADVQRFLRERARLLLQLLMPHVDSAAEKQLPTKPNTCIIGAGISGLTAGKALSDRGVPYTCFEASDDIGGNWYFGNPNGRSSAYRSLHIDTWRDSVSFRDMPMSETDYPDYAHHALIRAYIDRYAEAFGLRDRIRFKTAVEKAERNEGGGWTVTPDDGESHEFDFLIVGNGHHWDPRIAEFPGEFTGETIHSHHYLSPTEPLDMLGKRVLVIGIGNSAVDIVSELSRKGVAEHVFLSTRSGAWVMPKYLFGQPLGKLVKTNPHLPIKLQRFLARPLPYIASGKMEDYGLIPPNHKFLEAHPTVSSELLLRLGSGDAIAKPNVSELRGDEVAFEDGTRRADRRDRLRDGLQDHLPLPRPRAALGPRQPPAPLQARVLARDPRPRAGRLRAGHPHPLSVRRAAGEAGRPLRRRATTRSPPRPRWRRRSWPTRRRCGATRPTAPATRCRSTTTSTSTTSRRARCPRAWSAPGAARASRSRPTPAPKEPAPVG